MKLSKGQGISFFAAILIFGIFNIVVFLAPLSHTVVFWLGYFFALFALVTIALTLVLYFGKPVKEEKFLSLPAVKAAWTYFVLQTALSIWEMISFPLPYLPALIINLVLGAVFAVIILALFAASGRIENAEAYTAEKVIFIKQLKLCLDSIDADDTELEARIKALSEDVRFSDPMSHSKLSDIESSLEEVVDELIDSVNDKEKAIKLCEQAAKILKNRNEQCKMYKGVKDSTAASKQKSGNGGGVAIAGAGAALTLFLITLAVCFIIVPQNKYTNALALMKDEKYDEATAVFTELGSYRDSEEKVEEIKNTLLEKQYTEAEKLFNEGKYSEAMKIYSELEDYKESKLRIEQIYNRLSDGDILYFGTYNEKPISWKILKTEADKMLLLAEKPIAQKPFNNEIKKVTWETSDLRVWLNGEFAESFSLEQKNQIIETKTGNETDKIFLLSVDEMDALSKKVMFKTSDEWWTRTASDDGIMYTSPKGWVKAEGDQVVRDKGVRPSIWISLK